MVLPHYTWVATGGDDDDYDDDAAADDDDDQDNVPDHENDGDDDVDDDDDEKCKCGATSGLDGTCLNHNYCCLLISMLECRRVIIEFSKCWNPWYTQFLDKLVLHYVS